jgi:hypothetical protein
MQPPDLNALPPNTLGTGAAIFMLVAWAFVLGLAIWSFRKLIKMPKKDP